MKKYLFVLSTLVLFAFSSCQKIAGDLISKDFNIEGSYTALKVQDAFDVVVDEAATQVTVTVGENIMPKVVVEIVDNTLKIRLKGINYGTYGTDMKVILPYNADLSSVELSGASGFRSEYGLVGQKSLVELSGASDFYCDLLANEIVVRLSGASEFHGEIQGDQVDIYLSGSSNLYGNVVADDLNMKLSGSSDIECDVDAYELDLVMSGASDALLEGYVSQLNIDLDGSSNIVKKVVGNCYALACDNCEGKMSGSSDAYIHCDGRICVELSGASELHYTGDGISSGCSTTSGGSSIIGPEHP